jgi:hypothetical protein
MHQFLSVYFTLLLLHVSATMCHPQGARSYLVSYMPIWVLVDKIMCSLWLCVYYAAAWRSIIYTKPYTTQNFINQKPNLACNSEGTDELPEDAYSFRNM